MFLWFLCSSLGTYIHIFDFIAENIYGFHGYRADIMLLAMKNKQLYVFLILVSMAYIDFANKILILYLN